jgi:carboxymethylenebutenolidase
MPDTNIQGRDGSFSGYRAPARSGKGPGIVLIQEIFGVNRVMREAADWLAGEGYTVICPDLFWRQEPGIQLDDFTPEQWQKAFSLYQGFNEGKGVEDIRATIEALRKDPACNGRVGTIGYCLGGKLAYLAATRTDTDASVGYYGVGIEKNLDEAGKIRKPLLLHIAKKDQFVPPEAQEKIHRTLDAHSKVSIFDYEGCDHAFARRGGEHYNKEAAQLADSRTLNFFRRHLLAPAAMPEKPPVPPPPRPSASLNAQPRERPPEPRPRPAPGAAAKPAAPKPVAAKPAAAPKPAAAQPAMVKAAAKPVAAQPAAPRPQAAKPSVAKPSVAKPAAKAAAKRKAPAKPAKPMAKAAKKPKRAKPKAKRPAARKPAKPGKRTGARAKARARR